MERKEIEEKIHEKYFFRTIVSFGALMGLISFLSPAFSKENEVGIILLLIPNSFIFFQSALRMVGLFRPKWEKEKWKEKK